MVPVEREREGQVSTRDTVLILDQPHLHGQDNRWDVIFKYLDSNAEFILWYFFVENSC